ncbi:hypothetical protein F9802_07005 [Bacillus aerolatus]|uniref:Uncharacterized protein n=1 Tax=Bacillus aerolatus TaxID=2653354 RepID=A0A6I1FGY6_9BACI|nr:hypothetical protein [Bacillus aerolatus]KAB7707492.1 hypothetical protein F9802_07005 [Bacillus aerolatus]
MKQIINYIVLGACTFIAVWLYHMQLGAISFILLSIFLFYRAFAELKPKKKALCSEKPEEEIIAEKTAEKKAEIIT